MQKWPIQSVHLLATLLHPRLRDFSGDEMLKDKAIRLLKSSVNSSANVSINNTSTSGAPSSSTVDDSITIRRKDILSLYYDKPRIARPTTDEVMVWLQSDFDSDIIDDNLLLFWKKKGNDFPNIASIARKVLAIPAVNTSVVRLFSSAKITTNYQRTKLGLENIDKLMFLKNNLGPLQYLIDSQNNSTTYPTKRKSDANHEENDKDCASKKVKIHEKYEYEELGADCESEN